MDLAPGVHIDRFVVEAKLRSSALATVYRVRHLDHGSLHALKVLYLDRPTLQDRILAEGRAQASLRHPNVVAFTDVLDVGGNPGLLTEFVRGPSLERVLSRVRLDLEVVEQLVPGILAGVAAAHARQIVHRDLKPGNILLDVGADRVVPKIADFGLARLLGQHRTGITGSGATLTTANYMAPETIRNARSADARSDLFALGAILYELVTGHQAFANENVFATLSEITSGHYVAVTARRPETPPRIVEAIEAAMEGDVDARVANCEELWELWAGPGAEDLATAAARPARLSRAWALRLSDLAPTVDVPTRARGPGVPGVLSRLPALAEVVTSGTTPLVGLAVATLVLLVGVLAALIAYLP